MIAAMSVGETTPQTPPVILQERLTDRKISTNSTPIVKNGGYFLGLLDAEVGRLTCLCDKAQMDLKYNVMPEEVSGCIRTAIGKSQLLLTKKFKQFRKLCEDNLKPKANEKTIMCEDLQGFWDLIAMPIKDVHSMFDDVERLRKSKWKASVLLDVQKEKEPPTQSPRTKQRSVNKPRKTKSSENEEKSRKEVRERIAEAKRKVKQRMSEEHATNGDNGMVINDAVPTNATD